MTYWRLQQLKLERQKLLFILWYIDTIRQMLKYPVFVKLVIKYMRLTGRLPVKGG